MAQRLESNGVPSSVERDGCSLSISKGLLKHPPFKNLKIKENLSYSSCLLIPICCNYSHTAPSKGAGSIITDASTPALSVLLVDSVPSPEGPVQGNTLVEPRTTRRHTASGGRRRLREDGGSCSRRSKTVSRARSGKSKNDPQMVPSCDLLDFDGFLWYFFFLEVGAPT